MNYTQIKTWEDACKITGHNPETLPEVSMLGKGIGEYLIAIFKLTIISKAINPDGWVADYGNHDQWKHYPWFKVDRGYVSGSGGGFSFHGFGYGHSNTRVGARLAYSDEYRAEYAGKQFIDLYEKIQLVVN